MRQPVSICGLTSARPSASLPKSDGSDTSSAICHLGCEPLGEAFRRRVEPKFQGIVPITHRPVTVWEVGIHIGEGGSTQG